MEKKIENMTKKELIERINDLETQCGDKDTAFAALHDRTAKEIADLKKKVYEAATAREDDIEFYKESNKELKKKNDAIHEEAKRWKKEAVDVQKELDDLRASIGADDSDPTSVAIWKAKYHTLKYQFDKFMEKDGMWAGINPAVHRKLKDEYDTLVVEFNTQKDTIFRLKAEIDNLTENKHCLESDINYYRSQLSKYKASAALTERINVLEREIDRCKKESSEWEAKYEYQKGQTDCVVSDYNKLNGRYEALRIDYANLSHRYGNLGAEYSANTSKVLNLEARNKDLIKQCDELYDKNKELDAENSYLTDEVYNLKKKLKDAERRNVYLYDKNDRLKKTVNKMYGIASSVPDITGADDFEDRARKCAIIFSRTIDDMINAYNTDVNSYYDGSIVGVTKTVNTIHSGNIWLEALEESMRKFSEEAEKYIKKVGDKK